MILEKVKAVEAVFEQLNREVSTFQMWSGMHCVAGCGKCCHKPDIEATILEFLPFAHYLYTRQQAFEWMDKLAQPKSSLCAILNPGRDGGQCSEYLYRPLICRLFGFSARINKYEKRELMTCQVIKTEQNEDFTKASEKVLNGEMVPMMTHYYMQLRSIDFDLSREYFPINEAIKRAIEVILQYYAYRE